ncbi:DUF2232 domain-containing protein [Leptolyngbya ohadii]|uniref:DUF2232 domain-containing protein n=1 Tax=Leptolyngbya ohadii TaxID=1962290 RepID=UPI000B5A034B|nr:DUF2232 domain-containing protein [Leptolyngbya ohadii]
MSDFSAGNPADPNPNTSSNKPTDRRSDTAGASADDLDRDFAEVEASLTIDPDAPAESSKGRKDPVRVTTPSLVMVETAFLASTASLMWLVSYYLSVGPWMRILFPLPIALVYLRWGFRASWMSAVVSGLLLSVLMGPYLSILFCVPYAFMGVQLGAMWRRGSPWLPSIAIGTLISTFGFFFRMAILSVFLGEDLWSYLTNRITDLIQWFLTFLLDRGLVGIDALSQTNVTVVQIATIAIVLFSDLVYLFTVHLAAWLLLERIGNPIPDPPHWVQVLMDEER